MALEKRPLSAWCSFFPVQATVWQKTQCTRSTHRADTLRKEYRSHPQQPRLAEIELRNVCLSYQQKRVLNNLNLSVYRGESTAIIGTSGTGKSTTLRVISGLELPESGEVISRGWKRKRTLARERGNLHISMVFQNAALFDSLNVFENVGFRLLQQGKLRPERIYELVRQFLRRVDMEDAIEKYPEQLSGGMRKRVSLARAIIYDPDDTDSAPDVLLYDEPTAGLDPTASTRIENIIRSVQDVCPTCIVVTHQFSTIRRTADRVVLMHQGSVVWDGRVEDLDQTDNPYIKQFMSASLEGPLNSED
eukprot:gb/GEZJ01003995.1/.p1 GENE.gb/GEZJ01003995.1/~~gb/GEZJ01003995.1/.p1  ORF type:complete len:305 (-),score=34.87 gb/GEZJ01003995.1/:1080-1994(-)